MIKIEDLLVGQLYMFIIKGKLCCGTFTGRYTDDNKAIFDYNGICHYVEVKS